MGKVFFLFMYSLAAFGGTPPAKTAFDPFKLPADGECYQLGCNVRPADKVVQPRTVNSVFEPARRGCCSHHGGTCGCGGGKAVCCDGSFSPTCACD